jgi:hypothetical protein
MDGLLYTLWFVFLAVSMFQGAATGKIRHGRGKSYWSIPFWGRVICLILGLISTGIVIFTTVRYFSPLFRWALQALFTEATLRHEAHRRFNSPSTSTSAGRLSTISFLIAPASKPRCAASSNCLFRPADIRIPLLTAACLCRLAIPASGD